MMFLDQLDHVIIKIIRVFFICSVVLYDGRAAREGLRYRGRRRCLRRGWTMFRGPCLWSFSFEGRFDLCYMGI